MVVTWNEIRLALEPHDRPGVLVYGIPPNGMMLAALLQKAISVPSPEQASIILDDYLDIGEVREYYSKTYNKFFITLFDRPVILPWMATSQGLRK